MDWSSRNTVIDLTDESPPAHSRPRPSVLGADTHILDWSSTAHADRESSHGIQHNATASSSRSGSSSSRPAAATIVVGSDDEDDDNSFTITGQSLPVRVSHPLRRSLSMATAASTPSVLRHAHGPTVSASSVRFHDGIGRGPHGHGSHVRPSIDAHPLMQPRRPAAHASANAAAAAARRGAGGNGTATTTEATSGTSFASRLSENFLFGHYGFGTTHTMELLGTLLRGFRPGGGAAADPQQSAERSSKVSQEFDPKWTHPYDAQPGFTHNVVEPPVDLDTYFDDKAVVTGPLPETTPICPCCRHALVTGANGDERIWVLPCGHVIDGRCLDQLSELTPAPIADAQDSRSKGKGKAKATEAEDEPPAKIARTSARTRATAASAVAAEPKEASPQKPKKPKKPKRFECPVQGCGQKCTKESNKKDSAWEVFV